MIHLIVLYIAQLQTLSSIILLESNMYIRKTRKKTTKNKIINTRNILKDEICNASHQMIHLNLLCKTHISLIEINSLYRLAYLFIN